MGIRDRGHAYGGLRLHSRSLALSLDASRPHFTPYTLHLTLLHSYTTPRIQDGRSHIQPETIASLPRGLDVDQKNSNVCSNSDSSSGSGFGSVTSFALLHCSCFESPRNLIDHDESMSLSLSLSNGDGNGVGATSSLSNGCRLCIYFLGPSQSPSRRLWLGSSVILSLKVEVQS